MWRQCLFNEALAREEEMERREKEKKERKKREDEKKHKEKDARKEEMTRNLARARDAQAEDEARDKKGNGHVLLDFANQIWEQLLLLLVRPWNMHDEHLVERQAGPPPYQLHWCVPGRQLVSPKLPVDISCVFQDFIFNNGGLSVAFIFEMNWDCGNGAAVFSRVNALKRQYKNLYVFVAVPTVEQIESFNQSYFKYGMELGCPTFVPVND
ncbi:hypothetical protein D1007_07924 [Hordeum vulgare]|nr:hypothetical protein D1007_07924 [Hordeum vulgare]